MCTTSAKPTFYLQLYVPKDMSVANPLHSLGFNQCHFSFVEDGCCRYLHTNDKIFARVSLFSW